MGRPVRNHDGITGHPQRNKRWGGLTDSSTARVVVTQTGFIAAMAAELTYGAYDSPVQLDRRGTEWVIVSVWGHEREYLTLSRTGVLAEVDDAHPNAPHDAPGGLQPTCTHLGILLNRVTDGLAEISEYLLMRNQPADIPVAGVFHPTDGFVRVIQKCGEISLTGHGRFAHSAGVMQGRPVVHDVPDPAPGAEAAQAWHITGSRRPWIGEFIHTASDPMGRVEWGGRTARRPPALAAVPREPPVLSARLRSGEDAPSVTPPQTSDPHLASDGSTPHTRRRKRPEARHDVTTEA
jgi:hypothetical protein